MKSCLLSSDDLFEKMAPEITVSTDGQQDKAFAVAPELSHLKVTLNGFLEENGEIDLLVVSALIFCQERILVIQRAKTDTFPGCWEVPGGMCSINDETIFHGLAREVYEETGLRVVEVKNMVGSGIRFETPGKRFKRQWLKLLFEVAVAETERDSDGNTVDYGHVKVQLNPEEHQAFAWLRKKEVEEGCSGDVDFKFVQGGNRAVILQAFEVKEKYKSEIDE